ncbi:sulfurtransferase-like selenium metabolism protein YedF [Enterococcus sp. UD-01]|jgi:selenium metabolism protein YedF|uniref:sulfurtransferase-like selenium metabolism protein YedF n=1 Tax=Enterococcus sp. UD-01 TaxID=3373911 RepID=UPI003832BBCC
MIKINAIGKPCPIPVIEAKKAIRTLEKTGGVVEVLVDNDVAVENIKKMALGLNLTATSEQLASDQFNVQLVVTEKKLVDQKAQEQGLVIAVGRKTMGEGDPELGAILLKSYLNSLCELDTPPQQLLFFNSGAFLTNQESNALADLRQLMEKGTKISTCGACLDFYNLKQTLAVGEITNMYQIVETMAQAEKVITL